MHVFITGGTGFAGSHLVDQLLDAEHDVFALVHGDSSHQQLPVHPRLKEIPGNLLKVDSLKEAIDKARPDVIYHLAGQASPSISWRDPALTIAINAGGTANLLQAALAYGHPRVVVVTSAEIYGQITLDMLPLTEESAAQPRHPYGISKLAAGQLVDVYWQRYALPVVEARPFNHIGPRQTPGFVVPDFASQMAAVTHKVPLEIIPPLRLNFPPILPLVLMVCVYNVFIAYPAVLPEWPIRTSYATW